MIVQDKKSNLNLVINSDKVIYNSNRDTFDYL
jgi:hypothetical protein